MNHIGVYKNLNIYCVLIVNSTQEMEICRIGIVSVQISLSEQEKLKCFCYFLTEGKNPHPNQKLAWFLALFNHLKLCCNDSTFISSALVLAHTCIESLITSQQPSSFPIRDLMLLQEPLEVCTPCQVSLWSKFTNVSLTASQVKDSRSSCQRPVRCWNSKPK